MTRPGATQAATRVRLGSGLESLGADVSALVLAIDLDQATGLALEHCVDDLVHLSGSAERTHQLAGAVYLAFNGLERDPRQVHAIPECRAVLQALHARWPYWLHFMAPVPDLWTVWLLSLLPQTPEERLPDGRVGRRMDPQALEELMLDLTLAMNDLHDQHKLPLAARQAIFKAARSAVEASTGIRF
jgi:hypothetical protein